MTCPNRAASIGRNPAMENLRKILRVGTSGFSFPDWAKTFYRGIPRDMWLKYYVSLFDSLELNTTFYAIPPAERIEGIVRQLPQNFSLTVKVPKAITHDRPRGAQFEATRRKFAESILPAREGPAFEGLLFQFPVGFVRTPHNTDYVRRILDSFDGKKFLEFRHRSWRCDEVLSLLEEYGAGWVIPDVPDIPELTGPEPVFIGGEAYIRLHGRNRQNWYGSSGDRYDYLYSDGEIDWVIDLAKSLVGRRARRVFVFFNNCHGGKAAHNALKMLEKLGLYTPPSSLL